MIDATLFRAGQLRSDGRLLLLAGFDLLFDPFASFGREALRWLGKLVIITLAGCRT